MSTIFTNETATKPAFVMPAALSTTATAIRGAVVATEVGVRDRAAQAAAKAAHWGHLAWSPPVL